MSTILPKVEECSGKSTMKAIPRWWPSYGFANIMVTNGMFLTVFAIPTGVMLGWMAYHEPQGESKASGILGLITALICFVVGMVLYRVFGWFAKQYCETRLVIVRSITQELVDELVEEHYESFIRRCNKCALGIDQLSSIMHGYSELHVKPTAGAYEKIELERIPVQGIPKWSVKAFLWTENERKVNLTLRLTIAVDKDQPVVDVYDLHPS